MRQKTSLYTILINYNLHMGGIYGDFAKIIRETYFKSFGNLIWNLKL